MMWEFVARNCFRIFWKSEWFFPFVTVVRDVKHIVNSTRNPSLSHPSLTVPILISISRFKEDGEIKYYEKVQDLDQPDRSTLEVKFYDVEKYNQNLATTIIEEYYR